MAKSLKLIVPNKSLLLPLIINPDYNKRNTTLSFFPSHLFLILHLFMHCSPLPEEKIKTSLRKLTLIIREENVNIWRYLRECVARRQCSYHSTLIRFLCALYTIFIFEKHCSEMQVLPKTFIIYNTCSQSTGNLSRG